jgi:hypothetical protein
MGQPLRLLLNPLSMAGGKIFNEVLREIFDSKDTEIGSGCWSILAYAQ